MTFNLATKSDLMTTLATSAQPSLAMTGFLISLGAILGALSRFYITGFCTRRFGAGFPVGTLGVNLTGSLLIGIAAGLFRLHAALPALDYLVIIGVLGSYTTFSTYALDVSNLLRRRAIAPALLYWLGSPLMGFACVELGLAIARWLVLNFSL